MRGCQGGLDLCNSCEAFRFPHIRRLRSNTGECNNMSDNECDNSSSDNSTRRDHGSRGGQKNRLHENNDDMDEQSDQSKGRPVMQRLLSYIAFSMNSGTINSIRKNDHRILCIKSNC